MKLIKKYALSQLDPISGTVVDSFTISDKIHNAPSIRAVEEKLNGKANSSHTHTKSQITDFAHNHDDRYYTETESDNIFVAKGSIYVINKTLAANATEFVAYPSGFNESNCVIVSSSISIVQSIGTHSQGVGYDRDYSGIVSDMIQPICRQYSDGITIENITAGTRYARVVLMKIN